MIRIKILIICVLTLLTALPLSAMEILSPKEGEKFYYGGIVKIKYKAPDSKFIGIGYSVTGPQNWQLLEKRIECKGEYEWTIPENIIASDNCYFFIFDADNTTNAATSGKFSIQKEPKIKILHPKKNEIIPASPPAYTITWAAQNVDKDFRIELWQGVKNVKGSVYAKVHDIVKKVNGMAGKFEWEIKEKPGKNYRLRIVCIENEKLFHESEFDFEITTAKKTDEKSSDASPAGNKKSSDTEKKESSDNKKSSDTEKKASSSEGNNGINKKESDIKESEKTKPSGNSEEKPAKKKSSKKKPASDNKNIETEKTPEKKSESGTSAKRVTKITAEPSSKTDKKQEQKSEPEPSQNNSGEKSNGKK